MASDIDLLRLENPLPDVAFSFGINLQKNGNEWEACCPLHQEDTPSFTMFAGKDGVWRYQCFGCGEKGDVLDFVQAIKGVDFKEALKILGGEVRRDNVAPRASVPVRDVYADIMPLYPIGEIKAGARVKLWNPKREKFGTITTSMVFPYRAADGSLIGYVLRHDLPEGGKETPMVMWCEVPGHGLTWCRYPFPKPRPLFGLDRMIDGKQIIIAEGEKCATVGADVTGRIFMSWAGGTHGVNHADWSPLAGRNVVIWPDADAPGLKTADEIGSRLLALGCTVKILDVADKPKGWDVADASDEGWTRAEIDGFMRDRVRVFEKKQEGGDDADRGSETIGNDEGLHSETTFEYAPPEDYQPLGGAQLDDPYAGYDPDPYGGFSEVGMDMSDDLIEYDAGRRRDVPASGREKPGGHFRVWGGDIEKLREWVYLSSEGVFAHVHTGERMGKTSFDLVMANITPIVEILDGKGETKNVKFAPSKALIDYCDGLVCATTMYRPDCDALMVWVDGIQHMNAFLPSSVPDADASWSQHDAWKAARDHVHNIIPDGAETIIKWLAHNVQFPGKKILWAPIIVGEQGDGKTTIGKIVQMAMGRKNVSPVSPEALFSDFTSWAEGRCVRVLEEIRVQDKGRSSVMDKLKPMITNDVVDVVKKGKDGADVANVTNYIALTNFMDALAIDEGDRRWGVWKTRFKDRTQVVSEMGDAYWKRLHEAIGKHPEVIRGWLMNIDLSDFNPFSAPSMTQAKHDMIEASRSAVSADIRENIALGGLGVAHDVITTDCLGELMRKAGARSVNTTMLANTLAKMGWKKFDETLKWRGKSRRVYYLPGDWSDVDHDTLKEMFRRKLEASDPGDGFTDQGYW